MHVEVDIWLSLSDLHYISLSVSETWLGFGLSPVSFSYLKVGLSPSQQCLLLLVMMIGCLYDHFLLNLLLLVDLFEELVDFTHFLATAVFLLLVLLLLLFLFGLKSFEVWLVLGVVALRYILAIPIGKSASLLGTGSHSSYGLHFLTYPLLI